MYNHNKAQQSKNRVHMSWDVLYSNVGKRTFVFHSHRSFPRQGIIFGVYCPVPHLFIITVPRLRSSSTKRSPFWHLCWTLRHNIAFWYRKGLVKSFTLAIWTNWASRHVHRVAIEHGRKNVAMSISLSLSMRRYLIHHHGLVLIPA